MPDVPLFTKPAHPDAWHDVRAPGGYEWWYFDAEDAGQDLQVVGILLDGFPFHPEYLRRHAAYMGRPTRVPPPQPREYPCAYLAVYEKGRIAAQFMTQFAPGSLRASRDHPEVEVGPNRARYIDGAYELEMSGAPWKLTGRGPQLLAGSALTAKLAFAPVTTHAPVEQAFLSREMAGADHGWVLAQPHSRVVGDVALAGPNGKTWTFRGLGYHDHNFGAAPLGPGVRHWTWGRILFEDAAHVFHFAVPRDPALPAEAHLITVEGGRSESSRPSIRWGDSRRRTIWGLQRPEAIEIGDAIRLTGARVVDSSPFYLRATYDAVVKGRRGRAFCEVAYPHRLRWPILGRMVGMSIARG